MRTIPLLALLCLSFGAYAQADDPARQGAAIPPSVTGDRSDEPAVTITQEKELAVDEYRANGKLYMIKITPKFGPPYYLVDERGDGKFARQDSLDSGLRVPRWIIKSF